MGTRRRVRRDVWDRASFARVVASIATGIVAVLALLLLVVSRLQAQNNDRTRFSIHGIVLDSINAPVRSAAVSVYGFSGSATTNDRGEFALSGLMRGTRVLEVVALGFKPSVLAVMVDDSTPSIGVVLARTRVIVLDSMQVFAAVPADVPITSRRTDRITQSELSQRHIIGGSAFDAFAVLRPQLFHGRPASGMSATTTASQRAQMIARDTIAQASGPRVVCIGTRACDIDARLSVSINDGRPGSPDILTTLPVRIIKEMRYLADIDAAARFGISSGGGPVLVIYTR
jgi:hypothetical protein